MLDLVVRGGTVVSPGGASVGDVGIIGGTIVAVAAPGVLPTESAKIIEAAGKIVVPGGIDPHVHSSILVPTAATAGLKSADPQQLSLAAAYGGTTTLVDFATWQFNGTIAKVLEAKEKEWTGTSYVDHALHFILKSDDGAIPFEVIDQIGEMVSAGFPSAKIFMTNTTPSRPRQKVDLGYVWALLKQLARHGGILAVHAEDDDLVMFAYKELEREGLWSFENVHLAHTQLSEAISFRRIIGLAERAEAALYMLHVSAADGVRAVAESRARGFPIYGETIQHFNCFTAEDYKRPQGAIYHSYPSLKSEEDRLSLWAGLADGTLSTIATDEVCTSLAVKLRGKTIDDVTGGHAGIEVRMAIGYTETVAKRAFTLERFVALTSANAAKILGMYPRKGALAPGSDADIVIIDPSIRRQLSAAELHESDYSVFDGWEIHGWPVVTILRGKVIVEDGRLVGQPGDGQPVLRKLDPSVLRRPAC
jgi:dihydropyrimidinase